MVKFLLWVQKLLYYMIQHEGSHHIDFQQMSISPRQTTLTTARWLSAYMSLRMLATITVSFHIMYEVTMKFYNMCLFFMPLPHWLMHYYVLRLSIHFFVPLFFC